MSNFAELGIRIKEISTTVMAKIRKGREPFEQSGVRVPTPKSPPSLNGEAEMPISVGRRIGS